jgi:apolipoprotein N-acyltransferase
MDAPVAALFTLLFCVVQACYPALVGAALPRWRAPTPVLLMLVFPALWAIAEWLRSWLLSGFPWLSLGYSQVPSSPLAGFAPVLGVFGVSLMGAIAAGAIACSVAALLRWSAPGRPGRRLPGIVLGIAIALAVIASGAALKARHWTQPLPG